MALDRLRLSPALDRDLMNIRRHVNTRSVLRRVLRAAALRQPPDARHIKI
jgi:hypothetical protein